MSQQTLSKNILRNTTQHVYMINKSCKMPVSSPYMIKLLAYKSVWAITITQ